MSEQVSPDQSVHENELICEKLLGWIRHNYPANDSPAWEVPSKAGEFQPTVFVTPSFTTWADAGLILNALYSDGVDITFATGPNDWWCEIDEGPQASCETGPLAIRAAALEYIRRQS